MLADMVAPIPISCARWPVIARPLRRSRWCRTHQSLIWERTRHVQRLRHQLREFFPAALEAFDDLNAPDALELLGKAPDPGSAAGLTIAQISPPSSGPAVVTSRRRRPIQAALRSGQLGQPEVVTAAYAVTARAPSR